MSQLVDDLLALVGVWHDVLVAYDDRSTALTEDPFGGVAGPFPYENLVYVDFDGSTYVQTNVTFRGRPFHTRTFEADVSDAQLAFRRLGPDAPLTIGVSGGPGLIWYVPQSLASPGVHRYCEPDLIRIDGDRRTRSTVLWRNDVLVRPMLVTGTRLTADTTRFHALDPRHSEHADRTDRTDEQDAVHGERSVTTQYVHTA